MDVFEFSDYKIYLNDRLKALAIHFRGTRSRFAEALGCHNTLVSQILNNENHLTLEQAEKTNRFLAHGKEEGLYFLNLVQLARAGTPALKAVFQMELERMKQQRTYLKDRLKYDLELRESLQLTYYSHWYYIAVHAALALIKQLTQVEIANYLSLPEKTVREVISYLLTAELIREENGKYALTGRSFHLGRDSEMIVRHHTNWRLQALRDLDKKNPESLHYSSVVSISESDRKRVTEIMLKAIEQIREVTKDSTEEKVYCYALDFFHLGTDL